MNTDPEPESAAFLTKQELANMLRCSIRHVERLMGEGLPFIPIGGRKKLFCAESITRWLKSREVCFSPIEKRRGIRLTRRISEPHAYTKICAEMKVKREAKKQKALLKKGAK